MKDAYMKTSTILMINRAKGSSVGSMLGYLALVSCGSVRVLENFYIISYKVILNITARCVLVSMVLAAYLHFLAAVRRLFGVSVAVWSCLIMCTQFHFLFYASRPLPNSFAAVLSKLYGNKFIRYYVCFSWQYLV